jgi:hypothetical protein
MSGLWSGRPASIKLEDLDVICAVLGCGVEELLVPEPDKVQLPANDGDERDVAVAGPAAVTPKRRKGRSLPPV